MSSDIDLITDAVDLWSDEYRTDEYMRWAIESLRAEYGDPEQPMAMYQVEGTDPRSSLGRAIELERFGESFDNDADLLRDLYGTFEVAGNTQILCVVDHELGRPAGVIRTVRNTERDGCRILNDLQKEGEDGWGLTWDEITARSDFAAQRPEDIIDIPTIAVASRTPVRPGPTASRRRSSPPCCSTPSAPTPTPGCARSTGSPTSSCRPGAST